MTENDEKALSYYEGVNNKTRGPLIAFFSGKCWGIKLQKTPGLEVTSGEQKLKGTWAVQVKNLSIYCKCEVNVHIHQGPAKTTLLPVQFWLLGIASIPQAILIRGNISSCHIWFVSKCWGGVMNIVLWPNKLSSSYTCIVKKKKILTIWLSRLTLTLQSMTHCGNKMPFSFLQSLS